MIQADTIHSYKNIGNETAILHMILFNSDGTLVFSLGTHPLFTLFLGNEQVL